MKFALNMASCFVAAMIFGVTAAGATNITVQNNALGGQCGPTAPWSKPFCNFNNVSLPLGLITSITIGPGAVGFFHGNRTNLAENTSITVLGTLAVENGLNIQGGGFLNIFPTGSIDPGSLTKINFSGTAASPAVMINSGNIFIQNGQTFTIPEFATFVNQGNGKVTILPGGSLVNNGVINTRTPIGIDNQGTFTNGGQLNIIEGKVQSVEPFGVVTNSGEITIYPGGTLTSNGKSFTDSGILTVQITGILDVGSRNGQITFVPDTHQLDLCYSTQPLRAGTFLGTPPPRRTLIMYSTGLRHVSYGRCTIVRYTDIPMLGFWV